MENELEVNQFTINVEDEGGSKTYMRNLAEHLDFKVFALNVEGEE